MISVAAFTGGNNIPSARFRVRQYIPYLIGKGIELTEYPAKYNSYPPSNKIKRPIWAMRTLVERFVSARKSFSYDISLLQREMIATLYTVEQFTKKPRILDVDDAIWLFRKGYSAKRLASISECIICGNASIAEYFSKVNKNIYIVPTAVDHERYKPLMEVDNQGLYTKRIGWSGTSSGLAGLYAVEEALVVILDRYPSVRLRVLCDKMPRFRSIPIERLEFITWSPDNEVNALQGMTIGIMPMEDCLWASGKCSYKMLLYMSCGVPVVVSPLGMNAEVLELGEIGIGPRTIEEWVDALDLLLNNPKLANRMGKKGRELISLYFSIDSIAPKLADIFLKTTI